MGGKVNNKCDCRKASRGIMAISSVIAGAAPGLAVKYPKSYLF